MGLKYLILLLLIINITAFAQENKSRLIRLDSLCSEMDDKAPFFSELDKSIYFSRPDQNKDLEVWKSIWKNGAWGGAEKLDGPINNKLDNEVYHIDVTNGDLYFQKGIINDNGGGLDYGIFRISKTSDTWSNPKKQSIKYFKNKSEDQSFCISRNGEVMILSIEGYSSRGVEDLYVSFKTGEDSWSEPENLGATINTKLEEFTPYLADDNRTLFFSSNGHPGGYGSKDIWVSYRLKSDSWKEWSTPQNLGPSINTVGMETSFRPLGLKEYPFLVASTRTSNGMSDIFAVQIQKESIDSLTESFKVVEIVELADSTEQESDTVISDSILVDADTLASPLGNSEKNMLLVKIRNKSNKHMISGEVIVNYRVGIDTFIVSRDSTFGIEVDWLDTVHLSVKSENFLPQNRTVIFENVRFSIRLTEEFLLDSLELGKNIKLEHVLFVRGTDELLESSFEDLDYVVEILEENGHLDIEISGHTDNSGNAYLNQILSEKRANTIKKYLVSNKIETSRISTKGYGGSTPIASNETEETMKLNRRVEFKLLKSDKE